MNLLDQEQTDEEFFDAEEFLNHDEPNKLPTENTCINEISLKRSIDDCFLALDLFLNNKYSQAIETLKNYTELSMYHSMGYAVLLTMKALLTFDSDDKKDALIACKKAVSLANSNKRNNNKFLSLVFGSQKLSELTETELHAELCSAEANLVYCAMNVLSGSSYTDLIRAIFLIRECYYTYKDCIKLVEKDVELKTVGVMRKHFESGTFLGCGIFNILLSLLPDRILKMLKFVGFSGERNLGVGYLLRGHSQKEGIRSPLCSITYLFYNTYTTYILGGRLCDIQHVREILEYFTERYPNSAFTFLFKGRLSLIEGSHQKAIKYFEKCIKSQEDLKNFDHLCYWELMWCYCIQLKWRTALKYINLLQNESSWSKLIYHYHSTIIACCKENAISDDSIAKIKALPNLRVHFATKGFPLEKFFMKKGGFLIKNGQFTKLAIFESMYIFGVFNMIYDNFKVLDNILMEVKKQQTLLQEASNHCFEDFILSVFIVGVCHSRKGDNEQAMKLFNQVIINSSNIKLNRYLIPFSLVELGSCLSAQQKLDEAEKCLINAMKYKDHLLESRLHYSAQYAMANLGNL